MSVLDHFKLSNLGSKISDVFRGRWSSLGGLAITLFLGWLAYLGLFELVPAIADFIADLGYAVQNGAHDIARSIPTPDGRIRNVKDLIKVGIWLFVGVVVIKALLSRKRK